MNYLRSFSLLLASTVFSLVLFEGGFRAVHFFHDGGSLADQLNRSREANPIVSHENVSLAGLIEPSQWPDVVYELKPELTATFQGEQVQTNRWGMRGMEIDPEKKPDTIRIAGLGDSIMFGWGVKLEKSYLHVLEEKLKQSLHKEVEVLNFGVPGYNTAMEAALLEHRAITFQPDLILLQFVNNDWDVPAFMFEKDNPWDLSRSFLWDFIRERLQRTMTSSNGASKKGQLLSAYNVTVGRTQSKTVLHQYTYMTGPKGFRTAIERLTSAAKAKGIPLAVFYGTASPAQVKVLRESAKRYGFTLFSLGSAVDKYFIEHGLTNTPEERKRLLTVSPTDRHPSELGHQIIADALFEKVQPLLAAK